MTTLIPKFDLKDGGATPTGAVNRPINEKLAETVSVKDFGAKGDGTTDDTTAIQAALTVGGSILVPTGSYKITADLTISSNTNVVFASGAGFIAGANSITFFKSTTAYGSQIRNAVLDGNGYTGVTGFDLTNFRLHAGLYDCYCTNMTNGLIARYGCFGTEIFNFTIFNGVPYSIQVLANCAGLNIQNPNLNNESGTGSGTGIGIDISNGSGTNIGVNIFGGYIQGFTTGVQDKGLATKIQNTYFEVNTNTDVLFNTAKDSTLLGTNHFASVGNSCIQAISSDAISCLYPVMASGGRSTGVFNFDGTNTNCVYYLTNSASSLNSPIGVITGINSLPIQSTSTFLPVVYGTTTAGTATYSVQKGTYTKTGNIVSFSINVTWSGHTGTGSVAISGLPTSLAPSDYGYVPKFFTITEFAYTGPVVAAQLSGVNTLISIVQISTAGTASLIPITSSGTITIMGQYTV